MSIEAVPTPRDGYPDETFRVALGGSQYVIRWQWNEREGTWAFTIADAEGVAILSGVRVVLNVDLLEWTSDPRKPDGALLVVDPSGGTTEPTLSDLGQRVQVVFATSDELV